VAEQVGLFVSDQARDRTVGGDAEHLARLVAGDVQVAFVIEGQPVRQHPGEMGDLLACSGASVVFYADAEDRVPESLRHVDIVAFRIQGPT
jgi:hypothetical protein